MIKFQMIELFYYEAYVPNISLELVAQTAIHQYCLGERIVVTVFAF